MANKTFKFSPDLVPLVVTGQKNCTWRLWDDKDIKVGDQVTLIAKPELRSFAEVEVTSVIKKTMGLLTEEDKDGHEPFASDAHMYTTYSGYYGKPVDGSTPLTIYRFRMTRVMHGKK